MVLGQDVTPCSRRSSSGSLVPARRHLLRWTVLVRCGAHGQLLFCQQRPSVCAGSACQSDPAIRIAPSRAGARPSSYVGRALRSQQLAKVLGLLLHSPVSGVRPRPRSTQVRSTQYRPVSVSILAWRLPLARRCHKEKAMANQGPRGDPQCCGHRWRCWIYDNSDRDWRIDPQRADQRDASPDRPRRPAIRPRESATERQHRRGIEKPHSDGYCDGPGELMAEPVRVRGHSEGVLVPCVPQSPRRHVRVHPCNSSLSRVSCSHANEQG